jgi:uncharacterized membrane protein
MHKLSPAQIHLVAICTLAGLSVAAHAQSTRFIRLNAAPGGPFISDALGVSQDGRYVVGTGSGEAMLWSLDGGFVNVGNPNFDEYGQGSTATAVSSSGTVVGYVTDNEGNGNYRPWRWTAGDGFSELDSTTIAAARGVSADGNVIIGDRVNGLLETVGFVFSDDTGFIDLSGTQSIAFGVSADGLSVGGIFGNSLGPSQPLLWTSDTGNILLGDLPNGIGSAGGNAISADGQVVVGFARTGPLTFEAGRFTRDGNLGLGHLPNSVRSSAFASSGDGSIIGGNSITGSPTGASQDNAFLWFAGAPAGSPCAAMKDLKSLLQTRYRFDLTGYRLRIVNGISADGRVVIGTLQRPDMNLEGFVVIFGCAADFNNDGVLDFFDYLDFVQDFSTGLCNADYNNDGVVDFFDYLDFVAAFASGC